MAHGTGKARIGRHHHHRYSRQVHARRRNRTASTASLRNVIDGGCRKLLLNLTELSQIDSTGVSIIVATYVSLRRLKGEVKLLHPTGRVQTVLAITHLLQVIPNFEEEAKAVASFSARAAPPRSSKIVFSGLQVQPAPFRRAASTARTRQEVLPCLLPVLLPAYRCLRPRSSLTRARTERFAQPRAVAGRLERSITLRTTKKRWSLPSAIHSI